MSDPAVPKPLFPLGRVLITPAASEVLRRAGVEPLALLLRHQSGDWGEVDATDRRSNDHAVARPCASCPAMRSTRTGACG
jgi:hypothetical protein